MHSASFGYYNSRLSTACSNEKVYVARASYAFDTTTGNLKIPCSQLGLRAVRSEAALDDLNDYIN